MEEMVSLQPYYDDTDFKKGQLVTCMRLLEMDGIEQCIFAEHLEHRKVDFYGLIIKEVLNDDWFMVENPEVNPPQRAVFRREELGMGYQPSWHPMVANGGLHEWLTER